MKRNYIPFIAGMTTMLLLVGLVGASMAEETGQTAAPQSGTLNGQVAYGEAGVALFGKEQVPAGTTWTTEDGAQIPTVLTYTDENGENHYFVSAETTAEVLDVALGVVYREDIDCVDFGTVVATDDDGNPLAFEDGQPYYLSAEAFFQKTTTQNEDGTERILAIGDQKSEIQVGDVTITHGGELTDEEMEKRKERIIQNTATVPEYGVSYGVFTEVDPAELNPAAYLGRFVNEAYFQGDRVEQTFSFIPQLPYAALVIENDGKEDILVRVLRPSTVGANEDPFTLVRVPAGQTLTRAFRIEEGESADLRNKLAVEITSIGSEEVQVRLSSEQYSGGLQK